MSTQGYAEKNERIANEILNGGPYWLLSSDNDYYSLIQVASDRVPLPIIANMIRPGSWNELTGSLTVSIDEIFGSKPQLTIDRNTEFKTDPGTLLGDIVSVMMESQRDESNLGWWKFNDDGEIVICTHPSTDERYSRNGGNYSYYRTFSLHKLGVIAQDDWSAEFHIDSNPTIYRSDLASLEAIYYQACLIVDSLQNAEKVHVCPTCGKQIL